MTHRMRAILACLLLAASLAGLAGEQPIAAQGGGDTACPEFVSTALEAVGKACAGLGRDEACYGHNRIDATFWGDGGAFTFASPADRISLIDLRTIATAPLNLDNGTWGVATLNVRANVPDSLPGQAVTFLLMGDASLENAVPPEEAAAPIEPIEATVTGGANLRSRPTTTANIVGGAAAGDTLQLIGVNAAGDWYAVALEGGTAWIWGQLVEAGPEQVAALPVSDGGMRYGPMQAFYFTTGRGEPACNEAPDALVIQSPGGVEVALDINGLAISIGSTLVLTLAETYTAEGPVIVLLIALVDGHLDFTINGQAVTVDQPASVPGTVPVIAITLNENMQVDEASRIVPVPADAIAPTLSAVCHNVYTLGILGDLDPSVCEATPAPLTESDIIVPPAVPDPLAAIGPADACTVAPIGTIYLYGGPDASYDALGQFTAGAVANPDGYVTDADGFHWWRLDSGAWVRSDLVRSAGACDGLPEVTPSSTPPDSIGESDTFNLVNCEAHGGQYNLGGRVGQMIRLEQGTHRFSTTGEAEAARSGMYPILVDGVTLPTTNHALEWQTGGGVATDTGPDGWGFNVTADWVAVAGTHTVISHNYFEPFVCVLTIEP